MICYVGLYRWRWRMLVMEVGDITMSPTSLKLLHLRPVFFPVTLQEKSYLFIWESKFRKFLIISEFSLSPVAVIHFKNLSDILRMKEPSIYLENEHFSENSFLKFFVAENKKKYHVRLLWRMLLQCKVWKEAYQVFREKVG